MKASGSSSQSGFTGKGEGSSSSSSTASKGSGASHHLIANTGNGNGYHNGLGILDTQDIDAGFKPLYEGSRLDRTEFIRITLQSLKELGFE